MFPFISSSSPFYTTKMTRDFSCLHVFLLLLLIFIDLFDLFEFSEKTNVENSIAHTIQADKLNCLKLNKLSFVLILICTHFYSATFSMCTAQLKKISTFLLLFNCIGVFVIYTFVDFLFVFSAPLISHFTSAVTFI